MAGQRGGVLIALLAVLGVDLSVIVAVMAVVLARRRWVSRQTGAFQGAIRVIEGEVPMADGFPAQPRPGAVMQPLADRPLGRFAQVILVPDAKVRVNEDATRARPSSRSTPPPVRPRSLPAARCLPGTGARGRPAS